MPTARGESRRDDPRTRRIDSDSDSDAALRAADGAVGVTAGAEIKGGYTDQHVSTKAGEEGQRQLYTIVWANNSDPYPAHEITASAQTCAALLGHRMHAGLREIDESVQARSAQLPGLQAAVLNAINRLERSRRRLQDIEDRLDQQGVPLPRPNPRRRLLAGLVTVLIVLGELYLNSAGFASLGLSDQPLIRGIPFDERQLAALSSIVALVVLAEALTPRGEGHGNDSDQDLVGKERARRWAMTSGINVVGVLALLIGLATVRAAYLAATGQSTSAAMTLGFAALNLGVLLAARWIGRPDPRPQAARYQAATEQLEEDEGIHDQAREDWERAVGEIDVQLDARDHLLAQYGHAAAAARSDAERQIALWAGHVRLAQPEPIDEAMFPQPLPAAKPSVLQEDIRNYLLNTDVATPFRRGERVDTSRVDQRYALMERRLAGASYDPETVIVVPNDIAPLETEQSGGSSDDATTGTQR